MGERTKKQKLILGIQHTLAMFGATVLVPALTGLNTSITLFCAGLGTLLFHWVTKKKVPVFLGSSFAFMAGIMAIIGDSRMGDPDFMEKLASVKGALIIAGLVYVLFAGLIKIFGYEKVNKLLPPIVTGPIIIVIGLRLSGTAINSAFLLQRRIQPEIRAGYGGDSDCGHLCIHFCKRDFQPDADSVCHYRRLPCLPAAWLLRFYRSERGSLPFLYG